MNGVALGTTLDAVASPLAAPAWKNWRSLAARRRWAGQGNRRSWVRSMSNWPRATRATPTARFTALPAATASPECSKRRPSCRRRPTKPPECCGTSLASAMRRAVSLRLGQFPTFSIIATCMAGAVRDANKTLSRISPVGHSTGLDRGLDRAWRQCSPASHRPRCQRTQAISLPSRLHRNP